MFDFTFNFVGGSNDTFQWFVVLDVGVITWTHGQLNCMIYSAQGSSVFCLFWPGLSCPSRRFTGWGLQLTNSAHSCEQFLSVICSSCSSHFSTFPSTQQISQSRFWTLDFRDTTVFTSLQLYSYGFYDRRLNDLSNPAPTMKIASLSISFNPSAHLRLYMYIYIRDEKAYIEL